MSMSITKLALTLPAKLIERAKITESIKYQLPQPAKTKSKDQQNNKHADDGRRSDPDPSALVDQSETVLSMTS
jgi:hypothetical protein